MAGKLDRRVHLTLILREHYRILDLANTHPRGFRSYLKAFCFAASFSSFSFLSFCAGGVPVLLEAPESSPPFPMLLGPKVLRVFEPLAANIDVGPKTVLPCELACRDPALLPSLRRSSMPTVFFWKSGGGIMPYWPPPEKLRASPRPIGMRPPPPPPPPLREELSMLRCISFSRSAATAYTTLVDFLEQVASVSYLCSDLIERCRAFDSSGLHLPVLLP